ncbi:VOC family protein [Mesorhizobium sp. WSM3862]|uniref:VOC family protein n=1 Tax=Mesorhizobium sp. WSM3862 TaxID=632858 RepID=UPI000BAF5250|nr:VOC family protein [Mesorhizobium sp. WSM3862]PBB96847.1 glyoxalase [Mesorhizobium sp. WSM3862]
MNVIQTSRETGARERAVDMKLEVVVIPVKDVERAKGFYGGLGWRLDADFPVGDNFRVVQFTPPGSPASIHFGIGITSATPGSAKGIYLVVADIEAARTELISRGAEVSDIFHTAGPGTPRVDGPDPEHHSYSSFAKFSDPDGNEWILQEITARLPGRINTDATSFASVGDLAGALRRASVAHGDHEKRTGGQYDQNWPDWYAEYMVNEHAGKPLPT